MRAASWIIASLMSSSLFTNLLQRSKSCSLLSLGCSFVELCVRLKRLGFWYLHDCPLLRCSTTSLSEICGEAVKTFLGGFGGCCGHSGCGLPVIHRVPLAGAPHADLLGILGIVPMGWGPYSWGFGCIADTHKELKTPLPFPSGPPTTFDTVGWMSFRQRQFLFLLHSRRPVQTQSSKRNSQAKMLGNATVRNSRAWAGVWVEREELEIIQQDQCVMADALLAPILRKKPRRSGASWVMLAGLLGRGEPRGRLLQAHYTNEERPHWFLCPTDAGFPCASQDEG